MIFDSLSKHPLDPIFHGKVSLQLVTWETAFLVLLAAGARRGEIHVIPYMIVSYDRVLHPCDAVTFWKVYYLDSDQSGSRPRSFAFFHFRKNCLEDYFRRVDPSGWGIPLFPSSLSYSTLGRRATFIRTLSGWFFSSFQLLLQSAREESPWSVWSRAHEFRAYASP